MVDWTKVGVVIGLISIVIGLIGVGSIGETIGFIIGVVIGVIGTIMFAGVYVMNYRRKLKNLQRYYGTEPKEEILSTEKYVYNHRGRLISKTRKKIVRKR